MTELIKIIQDNDLDSFRRLCNDPNKSFDNKNILNGYNNLTLLHICVCYDRLEFIKYLITLEGIDVNKKMTINELESYYSQGNSGMCGDILNDVISLSPLLLSLKLNKNEISKLLLETTDVNSQDECKNTVIFYANEEMTKILLERTDIDFSHTNIEGLSVLDLSVLMNSNLTNTIHIIDDYMEFMWSVGLIEIHSYGLNFLKDDTKTRILLESDKIEKRFHSSIKYYSLESPMIHRNKYVIENCFIDELMKERFSNLEFALEFLMFNDGEYAFELFKTLAKGHEHKLTKMPGINQNLNIMRYLLDYIPATDVLTWMIYSSQGKQDKFDVMIQLFEEYENIDFDSLKEPLTGKLNNYQGKINYKFIKYLIDKGFIVKDTFNIKKIIDSFQVDAFELIFDLNEESYDNGDEIIEYFIEKRKENLDILSFLLKKYNTITKTPIHKFDGYIKKDYVENVLRIFKENDRFVIDSQDLYDLIQKQNFSLVNKCIKFLDNRFSHGNKSLIDILINKLKSMNNSVCYRNDDLKETVKTVMEKMNDRLDLGTMYKCMYHFTIINPMAMLKCIENNEKYNIIYGNEYYSQIHPWALMNIEFQKSILKIGREIKMELHYLVINSMSDKKFIETLNNYVENITIKLIKIKSSQNILLDCLILFENVENFDDFILLNKDILIENGCKKLKEYIKCKY